MDHTNSAIKTTHRGTRKFKDPEAGSGLASAQPKEVTARQPGLVT